MSIVYKVLGQSNPTASTNTTLYSVPSSTEAIVSTISICNIGSASSTYRIAVRPAGASIANQHYIVYDAPIEAYTSVMLTVGLSLATTDVITIYTPSSNVSFNAFGTEIS